MLRPRAASGYREAWALGRFKRPTRAEGHHLCVRACHHAALKRGRAATLTRQRYHLCLQAWEGAFDEDGKPNGKVRSLVAVRAVRA